MSNPTTGPKNQRATLPEVIAHLVGRELKDESSSWHAAFPTARQLAKRYRTSSSTARSALKLVQTQGLVTKHGARYVSARQHTLPITLVDLAAKLAMAITDRTITGRLPFQRQIAERYSVHTATVSRAVGILVQQGFVEHSDEGHVVAANIPTTFTAPKPKRSPKAFTPPRYVRKTHERKVFSEAQLIAYDFLSQCSTGLEEAGILAPEDIAKKYEVSMEIAGDVFFHVLAESRAAGKVDVAERTNMQ
ncbi:hypothetical protein [Amycolatopsis sp. cmx-11-51]|uniref:hypothetical protein n=1 Tax=Amycolatopsis sp. cmx-11-51 TaxID=2785797 RepID=UPI0039E723DE